MIAPMWYNNEAVLFLPFYLVLTRGVCDGASFPILNTQCALILEQEISGNSKLNHVFEKYKLSANIKI